MNLNVVVYFYVPYHPHPPPPPPPHPHHIPTPSSNDLLISLLRTFHTSHSAKIRLVRISHYIYITHLRGAEIHLWTRRKAAPIFPLLGRALKQVVSTQPRFLACLDCRKDTHGVRLPYCHTQRDPFSLYPLTGCVVVDFWCFFPLFVGRLVPLFLFFLFFFPFLCERVCVCVCV